MRQHNLATRPVSPRKFEPQEEEGVEYTVIAKYVAEPDDKPCYLTVRQSKHMGSGRFSDVFSGSITIGKAPNASAPEGSSSAQNTSSFPVAIKKIWPDKSREDLQIITHRLLCHHNVVKLIFYYACVHPSIKSSVWVMILEAMPSNLEQEFAKYKSRDRLMPRIYVKVCFIIILHLFYFYGVANAVIFLIVAVLVSNSKESAAGFCILLSDLFYNLNNHPRKVLKVQTNKSFFFINFMYNVYRMF